jgi:amidase
VPSHTIAGREASPVELTQVILERIGRLEPRLGSYATLTPDVALAQARRAEKGDISGER